jgi:hypothetical protein
VAGLVQHDSGGEYEYALPDLVRDAYADRLDDAQVTSMVREVESVFIDDDDIDRDSPTDASAENTGDSLRDSDTESTDHSSAVHAQSHAKLPESVKLAAFTDSSSTEQPASHSSADESSSSAEMVQLFSSQSEDTDGHRDPAAKTGLSDAAKRIAKSRASNRTLNSESESGSDSEPDTSMENGSGPISGADRRSRDGTLGRGGSRSSQSRR